MDGSIESEARDEMNIEPTPTHRQQYFVCEGITAEIVCVLSRRTWESHYRGARHLLVAHEHLARRRGETRIEGLPTCSIQNLSRTLTFVPAGRTFREWHEPDIPSHAMYIHVDPLCALMTAEGIGNAMLEPRLHFRNEVLWQTTLKVKTCIESGRGTSSRYADALGVILADELLRSRAGTCAARAAVVGGLTVWQRRLVGQYVEEHLAEHIPVAKLAALARLSRYHFCRSFRCSFGTSPHRYHSLRKVERAKELLANRHATVTDIAFDVGFRETSSFTSAFRKLAGQTPTSYRRSLAHGGG
jgi:AraC family transcriptional regulator